MAGGSHAPPAKPGTSDMETKGNDKMLAINHPHNPARRGFAPTYRPDAINHCPGCGKVQWYVGRALAECAFCGTAIPLQDAQL